MNDRPWPPAIQRLLSRLSSEEATSVLVGLAFDFAIDQPVDRYIDPDRVLAHLDHTLKEPLLRRLVEEHVRSFFDRELDRSGDRQDHLRDWLTEEARQELARLTGRPVHLRRAFLENLVQQEAVRHLLKSIIEETLARFVESLKPDRKGGLLAAVGRGAAGVASTMTRGLFSKLGSQLEAALSRAAEAFIEGSLDLMLRRTVDLLSSPQMAERLGELSSTGFDAAMDLTTHQVMKTVHRLPLDEILEVVPEVIAHNISREDLRSTALDEIRTVLEREGARPVREFLDESGAVDYWREQIIAMVSGLVVQFTARAEFLQWLDDAVKE